eukprot:2233849-Prymnesium_polylepis.1
MAEAPHRRARRPLSCGTSEARRGIELPTKILLWLASSAARADGGSGRPSKPLSHWPLITCSAISCGGFSGAPLALGGSDALRDAVHDSPARPRGTLLGGAGGGGTACDAPRAI